jgi:hypothetical protein
MSKRLREEEWIYVAPKIRGRLYNSNPEVTDEVTNTSIDCRSTDGKILIYKRQVEGWFLGPAEKLLTSRSIKNSGFIVLMIGTSYIEGTELYRTGANLNNTDGMVFINGIQRIFGVSRTDAGILYSQLRGGLFHNGMTGDMVIISSSYERAIFIDRASRDIRINHKLFLKTIIEDFHTYIDELRNNTILRTNFSSRFSIE